jgi:serine protease AprX
MRFITCDEPHDRVATSLLNYYPMNITLRSEDTRRKAVWGPKRALVTALLIVSALAPNAFAKDDHSSKVSKRAPGQPGSQAVPYKLDRELTERSKKNPNRLSSVIVTLVPGAILPPQYKKFAKGGRLDLINGQVLELTNGQLKQLAAEPTVFRVHDNRATFNHNYRTAVTVGAKTVQDAMKYTGAGVGVAVIDSGITTWHDDLTNKSATIYPYGNQRVRKFVDFVNGRTLPYDDNGHGSHVAGIILGNGYDSKGEKSGMAPDASLVSLKVLDANGQGTISNIISALGWIATNAKTYNIRVVNMSVGASIRESYWTDPLTLAAKAVTDLGITVVTAAGNMGKNADGHVQYGGITAPGNAPWVLTVGASSTMGTLTRKDDTMASYSSNGPTFIDYEAKPDLVAPGTGTVSLAVPGSTFYATKAQYLLDGSIPLGQKAYLTLSGTSMAAPVVAGTAALMLQANPNLTPNLIKAILQYTAEVYPGYDELRQGAGFLNTLGAVRLAEFYKTAKPGDKIPVQKVWSQRVVWGNYELTGGYLQPSGNAWANNIVWGTAQSIGGQNIVWGTTTAGFANIVWGTSGISNIVWGTSLGNIVWGTSVGNIVWGTSLINGNIVWGTGLAENIVWGTSCDNADCDGVTWGEASPFDNIVWGTALPEMNIVWGTSLDPNVVWGTSAGNDGDSWGSSDSDAVVYPDDATGPVPDISAEFGDTILAPVEVIDASLMGGL